MGVEGRVRFWVSLATRAGPLSGPRIHGRSIGPPGTPPPGFAQVLILECLRIL
jgi:hypothetical protein